MQLRYPGPHDSVEIAQTRQLVQRGEAVEVTGDLAQSLLKQGWERVDKPETREEED